MEKLLHERMREWADQTEGAKYPSTKMIYDTIESKELTLGAEDERKAFHILADEIERYYIPRPRFEDGEPVKFGSNEIEWEDTDDYAPQVPWKMDAISQLGIPMATAGSTIVSRAAMTDGKLVKRHAPKVYDADGVEINVGENRWDIKSDIKITVSRFKKDDGGNTIVCANGDVCELEFSPTQLTNKEPDSLEKLRDDISRFYSTDPEAMRVTSTWYQRIESLIERGA